jgi:hypothetical protein
MNIKDDVEGITVGTETINESSGGGFGGFGGWGGGFGLVGLIGLEGLLGRHRGEGEGVNLNTNIDTRFNALENRMDFDSTRGELFGIEKSVLEQGSRNDAAIRDQTFHLAQGQEGIRAEVGQIGGRISRELLEDRYLNAKEAAQTRWDSERSFERLSRENEKNTDRIIGHLTHKEFEDLKEQKAELRAIITRQDNTIERQALKSDLVRVVQEALIAAGVNTAPPIA